MEQMKIFIKKLLSLNFNFNLYFNKRENLIIIIDKEFSDEALKANIYDNSIPSEYFAQRVK